jgi:hypothetical protein
VPGEDGDEQREGAAEIGAEVGQEAGAVAGLPVDEEAAVGAAVQQVPQVGVEGHVLVAEVVDAAGAGAEGVAAGEDVPGTESGDGDGRAEQGCGTPRTGHRFPTRSHFPVSPHAYRRYFADVDGPDFRLVVRSPKSDAPSSEYGKHRMNLMTSRETSDSRQVFLR